MALHILGVNTVYHESSACLLRDGEIVATAEEERFSRIRYGKHSRVDNPDELPEQAMAWCLIPGGIGWKDLAAIGYSLDPEQRRRQNVSLPDAKRMKAGDWGTPEGEETYYRHSLAGRDKLIARAPRLEKGEPSRHLPGQNLNAALVEDTLTPFLRLRANVAETVFGKEPSDARLLPYRFSRSVYRGYPFRAFA